MKFGALYEDFAKNMNRNSVSVAFLTVIIYMHMQWEKEWEISFCKNCTYYPNTSYEHL